MKFGSSLNATRGSSGGGKKQSPITVTRGKATKFKKGTLFRTASFLGARTPEQIAFDTAKLQSANLNTRLGNQRVRKANVFIPSNISLPSQITEKANAQGGTDFSINFNETLTIKDAPFVGNLPPPPSPTDGSPPSPIPTFDDIFDFIANFFGGGSNVAPDAGSSEITIQVSPPAILPEQSDNVLFPEFDTSSVIGAGGSTDQPNGEKGFFDSLLEKPENLVLAGTAIVALIAGLK